MVQHLAQLVNTRSGQCLIGCLFSQHFVYPDCRHVDLRPRGDQKIFFMPIVHIVRGFPMYK